MAVISNNLYAGCTNGNIYWSNIQAINNGWVSIGNPTSITLRLKCINWPNNNLYAVSTDKNLYSYSLVERSLACFKNKEVWRLMGVAFGLSPS